LSSLLKPIVIIGAGGYAQEVAWLIDDINSFRPEWDLLGYIDPVACGKTEHYGRPVLGGYDAAATRLCQPHFVCGMGTPAIRLQESKRAEERGWQPASLLHPSVARARFVTVGEGTTVGPGCVLGPYVTVGRHCVINMHATIGHDASVGSFSVISPGAHIAGRSVLESGVFVGANASVYPGRRMGAGATLGANSFLHSDLAAGQSALGVPAKPFFRK
jgi:sugar O-acyltransferase (sialic acid O-acetyltransferase NeuD family)